jgi:predicted nucleotidyltransferase
MSIENLTLPIKIDELHATLRKHGVVSAQLFGSYARGEARPGSDLDLLVKMKSTSSLFDLVDLQLELESMAHCKVDVATKLHPRFEPYITPDLLEVF